VVKTIIQPRQFDPLLKLFVGNHGWATFEPFFHAAILSMHVGLQTSIRRAASLRGMKRLQAWQRGLLRFGIAGNSEGRFSISFGGANHQPCNEDLDRNLHKFALPNSIVAAEPDEFLKQIASIDIAVEIPHARSFICNLGILINQLERTIRLTSISVPS